MKDSSTYSGQLYVRSRQTAEQSRQIAASQRRKKRRSNLKSWFAIGSLILVGAVVAYVFMVYGQDATNGFDAKNSPGFSLNK